MLPFFETLGFKCPKRKGVADFLQEVTSRKDQAQYWCVRDPLHVLHVLLPTEQATDRPILQTMLLSSRVSLTDGLICLPIGQRRSRTSTWRSR